MTNKRDEQIRRALLRQRQLLRIQALLNSINRRMAEIRLLAAEPRDK